MNSSGLIAAIQAGDLEGVRVLLAGDASLAATRDESGVSALMHCLYRRRQDMADLLLAASRDLDIFEAASLGSMAKASELLRQNPELIHAWSADGFTALHFACFFAREEMAIFLIQQGAEPNAVARNAMKVTALHSATAARNLPIMTILLQAGASPNLHQQQGWTALHSAAQHGDRAMVELLLQHGAERRSPSEDGSTPSALAAKSGHPEIEKLLL